MKRKEFLKKASSGFLAAAVLPLLSFDKKKFLSKDKWGFYKYATVEKYDNNGKKWKISFETTDFYITKFEKTPKEDRFVTFDNYNTKLIKTSYKIIDVKEKQVDSIIVHFLSLKMMKDKMEQEAVETAEDLFGKDLILEIHHECHAEINTKKSAAKINLKFVPTFEGEDCFLTSACVYHKGLPDNCKELTTLRNLRETKMNPNLEYQKLIAEYEIIAPQMLMNINNAENKNEILDVIYNQLVLPSVALAEAGKEDEAIKLYADFVREMKSIYL